VKIRVPIAFLRRITAQDVWLRHSPAAAVEEHKNFVSSCLRVPTNYKNAPMEKEFLDMINAHRSIIYKVCNLYIKEKEYRRDLFQEIVLQLWRSFPTFRKEAKASTWMYRVALNTAISQFRRDIKKPESQSLSYTELQIPDLTLPHDESDDAQLLKRAIGLLTRIEKALLILYLDEKSYNEIGEIMGITPSNVGVKLNRIKAKLEKTLKENKYES
jgi:RNA polymerase sigma factor (sigma-70 family)